MATPLPNATAGSSTLTPALFRRLHPKPYLEKFLSEGVRPDGRELKTEVMEEASSSIWRETSLNIGSISTAPSSTLVRIGSTTVVCGITLEIATPDIATPNHGFIVPNIDLPALCSPLFRSGPPSDEAQVLSSRLREILLASGVLPLSSLIIEPGKAAFVVYLDVVCLNFDGGVLDAAVLACMGALKNLRLPKPTWDIDTNTTTCELPTDSLPGTLIALGSIPLTISCGFLNGHLLPDPTLFESQLCTTHVSITVDSDSNQLINLYQAGAPFKSTVDGETSQELLQRCITLAQGRAKQLLQILSA